LLKNPSYKEATALMLSRATVIGHEKVSLTKASGRILAEDVLAHLDIPPFDRSAYDGYAFRAADCAGASSQTPMTLKVTAEITAGASSVKPLKPGEAVKILTGAPIPPGADSVVMFEATEFTAREVTLFEPFRSGQNIVPAGEDVRAGTLIAAQGSRLDPALVGALAAQGHTEVPVFQRPKVGLISTGSELAAPGSPLAPGFI
jgi:molybdopterin molybdotransferase